MIKTNAPTTIDGQRPCQASPRRAHAMGCLWNNQIRIRRTSRSGRDRCLRGGLRMDAVEQVRRECDIAVVALFDAEDHALAVDVRDFERDHLTGAREAGDRLRQPKWA